MSKPEHKVKLSNLGWGYQVGYDNVVIKALHDTIQGPRRTPECEKEAQGYLEKYTALFARAATATEMQRYQLAQICQVQNTTLTYGGKLNGNSAAALIRKGLIRRSATYSGANWLDDFEPIFIAPAASPKGEAGGGEGEVKV